MRSKIASLIIRVKKHPARVAFLLSGSFWSVTLFFVFFYNHPVAFSYSGNNCFRDAALLPQLYTAESGSSYELHTEKTINIKGYTIYSGKTCIQPTQSPTANSQNRVNLSIKSIPFMQKRYAISSGAFPHLDAKNLEGKISIREPLKFAIDQPDKVFSYRLAVADQSVSCDQKDQNVACDISKLGLAQGKEYAMRMERFFGDTKIEKVRESSVITVEPIVITNSSVAQGAVVYDSPTEIVLTANKPLISASVELLQDKQIVEQTTTVKDNMVIIKLAKPLPRKAQYSIVLKDALAQDKGVLPQTQNIPFTTSGGPKVVGVNIGRVSVDPGRTVVVTFDQPLSPGQDISKQIGFVSGPNAVNYTASISGNQLLLSPKTALPVCSTFAITTTGNISSNHNIAGDSAWSISSRLRCYTISAIGYSAQGRPIYAWKFGSGASKVLYVGSTHGDEKSTKYTLDSWVQELDYYAEKIPANKTVIVVPSVNPDGFAIGSRKNGRGVDLNRNFPTNDWKPDVKMPGGEFAVGGGGPSPLSEPESQALSNYLLAQRPDLALTYHSVASVVSPNGSGSSGTFASLYSQLSGYRNLPKTDSNTIFQYDITGAFEDWLYEKVGIPALLVELGSHTSNEFSKNKSAMWRMIQ